MNDYSLNESAYRAKLAVRGVGYSWGAAEDASRALYWLSSRQMDGFSALCTALTDIDSNLLGAPTELTDAWHCKQSALCPLAAGMCLSDCASRFIDMQSITLSTLAYPILTLPFLSDVASVYNRTLKLSSSEFEAVVGEDSAAIKGDSTIARINDVTISCGNQLVDVSDSSYKVFAPCESRVNIAASVWQQLGEFAHRTYAPATEQSRLLGAGAGVVDSD